MQTNIMLCGVGGQGIVLTSKLIAAAAMKENIPVMSAETIGMAQKGGSVFSFLRLGDDLKCPMFAPKSADILIAFEPAEAVRMLGFLKDGGKAVVNTHAIMPVTAALKGTDYTGNEMLEYLKTKVDDILLIDGNKACEEIGSPKVLNMVMLGAALSSGVLPFDTDKIEQTMRNTVKPQFHELNSKALRYTG